MKSTLTLLLATFLGLVVCTVATAQIPGFKLDPSTLGKLRYTPNVQSRGMRPAPTPTAQPNLSAGVRRAIGSGALGLGVIGRIPYTPQRSGPIPLPPGPIREFNPVQPQSGPVFNLGGGRPSVSFATGNGTRFNIGLPGQRHYPQHQQYHQPHGYQTPTQVLGYGPHGEVHTGNGQVAGSYHTPGRNLSQLNGSQRNVQRPIYDNFGNVVGYQAGTVWQNSITGQEHGNMTTYTPNGTGGSHQTQTLYSSAGGNITPIKN